ncbi:hypothetical protein MKZ23_24570 [Paenibacillus sp. FSL R5-0876]|jgi:UDP-3-O-[3-hydroxymyristoyl] glucosamine N-acyltransferase|uniref:hypothetical protein n=1 Tax=unclassified Paenibacillus TaxID=185978 RepID=UPI0030DA929B
MLLEGCDVALLSVDITASKPTHAISKCKRRLNYQFTRKPNYLATTSSHVTTNYLVTTNSHVTTNYLVTTNSHVTTNYLVTTNSHVTTNYLVTTNSHVTTNYLVTTNKTLACNVTNYKLSAIFLSRHCLSPLNSYYSPRRVISFYLPTRK